MSMSLAAALLFVSGTQPFSTSARTVARVFVAAGDVQRLGLLVLLLDGPMSIRDLARATGRPTTLVSQQVRVLRDAGVVKMSRKRRHHLYGIADGRTHGLLATCIGHAIKSRPDG